MADALIKWAASRLERWPCRLRIRCFSDQGRGLLGEDLYRDWLRQQGTSSLLVFRNQMGGHTDICDDAYVCGCVEIKPTGSLASWGI